MRRPKPALVYFCAVFNKPVKRIYVCQNDKSMGDLKQWKWKDGKILVEFENSLEKPLLMNIGLSFTNEDGAAKNLYSEAPGWDFDIIKNESIEQWNSML